MQHLLICAVCCIYAALWRMHTRLAGLGWYTTLALVQYDLAAAGFANAFNMPCTFFLFALVSM